MQIKSLVKKLIIMFMARIKLAKFQLHDNMYYRGKSNLSIKNVMFYFPFYEFMHYGDHLFFEPVINFMVKSGFNVTICPINNMKFYFNEVGYKVIDQADVIFEDYDLVISRVEFFAILNNVENLIVFKIVMRNIKKPLAQDMIDKLANFLNVNTFDIISSSPLDINKYLDIFKHKKHLNARSIIFNNYVDSGSYSVILYDRKAVLDFAIQYAAKKNYQIILTGTANDKTNDSINYPSNFIDIRGETSTLDLFMLLNDENVLAYIGFDGFLMHLANMYNKESFVFVRRSTMIQRGNNVNKMLTPYVSDKNLVTIINNYHDGEIN